MIRNVTEAARELSRAVAGLRPVTGARTARAMRARDRRRVLAALRKVREMMDRDFPAIRPEVKRKDPAARKAALTRAGMVSLDGFSPVARLRALNGVALAGKKLPAVKLRLQGAHPGDRSYDRLYVPEWLGVALKRDLSEEEIARLVRATPTRRRAWLVEQKLKPVTGSRTP